MMDPVSRSDFHALLENASPWCVSLYMPTMRIGAQVQQNRIRLKNLLAQAEAELLARGVRAAEAREILAPGAELIDDAKFGSDHPLWRDPSDGLALFCDENECRHWRVPLPLREFLWVGPQFYLKPLWPLLSREGEYYLLAVSQKHVALYRGTAYQLEPLPAENLPADMQAALQYDQAEGMYNVHRGDPGLPGKEGSIFHGGASSLDTRKDDLRAYFRVIDRGLPPVVRELPAPLVFAGVDYLFSLYQEVNTYPHLVETAIQDNVERMTSSELHALALPIVEPLLHAAEQRDMTRYQELTGTELGSDDLAEVVRGAFEGRIDALFVATDQEFWGRFDPTTFRVEIAFERDPTTVDLLDLTATEAYRRGARIHAHPTDRLPQARPLAALFRHPAPSMTPR